MSEYEYPKDFKIITGLSFGDEEATKLAIIKAAEIYDAEKETLPQVPSFCTMAGTVMNSDDFTVAFNRRVFDACGVQPEMCGMGGVDFNVYAYHVTYICSKGWAAYIEMLVEKELDKTKEKS